MLAPQEDSTYMHDLQVGLDLRSETLKARIH